MTSMRVSPQQQHDGNKVQQHIHIPPQQPMQPPPPPPEQQHQQQPVAAVAVVAAPKSMSVTKTLARLFSIPSNRRCADCRVTLVDASQVFISYSPPPPPPNEKNASYKSRYNQFMANHLHFAPPGYHHADSSSHYHCTQEPPKVMIPESSSRRLPGNSNNVLPPPLITATATPLVQDPCLLAHARTGGGYGVFVCAMCGAAHKLLGPSICSVHAIQDVSHNTIVSSSGSGSSGSWTKENVQHVARAGGNQRAWDVYEAYVPHHWMVRGLIPNAESSIADRLTFVRAKYQALAFILPPSGQLAPRAWRRIMDLHPEWKALWGSTNLHSLANLELSGNAPMTQSFKHLNNLLEQDRDYSSSQVLPNRLVDYFCVVTASDYLDPSFLHNAKNQDLSKLARPDELRLLTEVTDCFPDQNAHDDTEFPEHVGAFLFPDGCSPKSLPCPPSFFTFVLTGANGSRLYGAVLRLYDKSSDVDGLKQVFENSGYMGKLPAWLSHTSSPSSTPSTTPQQQQQQTSLLDSDLLFYPKCLVILSHYPFFDLWRKFLLQIYRIALVEAPLPIERFIANFVAEVPLPPPGKIQVQFGFTANEMWSIRRPAQNQLPLFNCSYQPLFTVLSVSNVLVVMACLLQETRVALVSQHYALLGPVAEALLSILFPFHWQGVYLPVMPYTMVEILEAPVPYLVGLHSRYLKDVKSHARPHGIVFVDLDYDVVHLGNQDEDNNNNSQCHQQHQQQPRGIPSLPERQALKLKAKLDMYAALVYVAPNSGKVGTVTQGSDARPVPFSEKCAYAQITAAEIPSTNSSVRRQDVLGHIDIAYRDSELLVPITGFLSEHGQFYEKEASSSSTLPSPSLNNSNHRPGAARGVRKLFGLHRRRSSGGRRSESFHEESAQSCNTPESLGTLLDLKDPPGFSAVEIRGAFLRFFVSVLSNYREYLSGDSFRATDFLSSLNSSGPSLDFVHSMTKTQMFQRFLQERRDNPNDPEVLFFDASINAKRNRSKKTALMAGRNARKETSFLDDTSREYTDTYTPPVPSNWGLPYDGRAYHYGAFPELDPSLFGKIRKPLEWSRELTMPSMRSARRASMAAIGHEKNFVSKALKPVIMSPATLVSVTKHGMKSLENALVSLSAPFANQMRRTSATENTNNHGGGGGARGSKQGSLLWGGTTAIASEASATSDPMEIEQEAVAAAEEVVLNARRKAIILLGIFTILQAHCRVHLEMKKSRHGFLIAGSPGDMGGFANENGGNVDLCYESAMATRVQSIVRGFLACQLLLTKKHAAISIQARTRGRRIRLAYRLLIYSVSKLQTRCRGYLIRGRLEKFFEVRMRAYRDQIFKLWQRAYTPLSYRTKFWPFVAKQYGFVRQGIAETELIRLWKELGIPVQDGTGGSPMTLDVGNDIVVRRAKVMGMSHWVYAQCVLVDSMLSGTPGSSSTTASSTVNASKRNAGLAAKNATKESVIKGHNHNMLRLIAERKQVYERLAAIQSSGNDEKLLLTISFFGISHKDKKKKHALAEALWQDDDLADESRLVIMQLFPELKQSSDICFVELPKKGVAGMRFRAPEAAPVPIDSSLCGVHTLLEDRIRQDVTEVASACMLHGSELTLRLSRCRGMTEEIGSQRQRRAAMSARGLFSWEECRLEMMKSLIHNSCPSRQIKTTGSMRAASMRSSSKSPTRPLPARLARRNSTQNLPIKKSVRKLSMAVTMPDLLNGLFPRSSMSSTSQAVEEELAIAESVDNGLDLVRVQQKEV